MFSPADPLRYSRASLCCPVTEVLVRGDAIPCEPRGNNGTSHGVRIADGVVMSYTKQLLLGRLICYIDSSYRGIFPKSIVANSINDGSTYASCYRRHLVHQIGSRHSDQVYRRIPAIEAETCYDGHSHR